MISCIKITSNLVNLWDSGDYDAKTELQDLLFPEGIQYDRKKDIYRTNEVNEIVEITRSFREHSETVKDLMADENIDLSAWVAPAGIEPASSESESEILSIEIRSHILRDFCRLEEWATKIMLSGESETGTKSHIAGFGEE